MNDLSKFSWLIDDLAIVFGALMVVAQLRSGQRLGKAQYVADINGRLAGLNDCLNALFALTEPGDFERLSKAQQERMLDYFTIFEVVEALRQQNVFSTPDIAYFFGGRLGDLTSNPGLQKAILYGPAGAGLAPMFSLHDALVRHCLKRLPREQVMARFGDLAAMNPDLYQSRKNTKLFG